MKHLIIFLSFFTTFLSFSQCNVVATAMPTNISCYGDCNGSITYVYQNTNMPSPGVPYIVTIQNSSTGQTLGVTTYMQEIQTIPFTGLCAGTYQITVQGQGCSFVTYATITQAPEIIAYVNGINPSPSLNNGSATIIATGGTGTLTYSLNGTTYQASNSFTGLAAGTYTSYVKDANGCIEQVQFTLTSPSNCNIVVTAYGGGVSCSGSCNAVVQYAYANGAYPPYVIELQNPTGQVVQVATNNSNTGSGAFTNVCAGSYVVEVTDANGCSGSYNYTVSQPTQITVTNVSTVNTSFGNSVGSATFTVTGGTPGYTYSLDGTNYQASNIFTNLSAGVYITYIKDANGCITIYCFVIQETSACTMQITNTIVPPLCAGSCNGIINYAYTMAAAAPVTISLQSNGNTIQSTTSQQVAGSGTFTNLCAGNYILTITDAAGCTQTNTINLPQATPIVVTAIGTAATSGNNNGIINVMASGGTAPYTYALNAPTNWQSSNSFTGLAPGVYIAYAMDANGCISLYTIQLTQVTGCILAINGNPSPVSCAYASNGSVLYNYTSSGTGTPFTISLLSNGNSVQSTTTNNSAGTGTFSNVASGVYTLQIVAANGCMYSQQIYVGSPAPLLVTDVIETNATLGNSDGSAQVIVSGGTAPYSFSLDNGVTWGSSNMITGLAAGFYIMQIEDANGCMTIYCFVINESAACATIAVTMTSSQGISCSGSCNGAIDWAYSASALNGPYLLTLSNGNTTVSTNTSALISAQGSYTGLCAGTYSLTVTDANGCSGTYSYTLVNPQPLIVTVVSTNASAGVNNGVANVYATGGTGQYLYSLNGTTWQNSNVFTGLSSGVHIAYVQDANGCVQLYTFVIGTQSACNIAVTASQTSSNQCGGSCDADILFTYNASSGTGPFTVSLSDQNGNVQTQIFNPAAASGNFSNLCNGIYILTVQDVNGCIGIFTVLIGSPNYLSIGTSQVDPTPGLADGSFTMNVSGGTPTYEYSIDNQATWTANNTFTNLSAGVYLAYTKDANLCTQVTAVKLGQSTASITELEKGLLVYPNPTRGIVFIESDKIQGAELFSISGQREAVEPIKTTNGVAIDLNGLSTGVYMLKIEDTEGKSYRIQLIKE